MIIGLTGSQCAGKDTIIEYLATQGFDFYSISTEVRKEAKRRNLELSKTSLQDLGDKIRKKDGLGAWAKRALESMQSTQNYIVGGIRNPGEISELKKDKSFFLISLDAPSQLRFTRMVKRNREGDPKTWEDFLKIDSRDKGENQAENGQQVSACMELADFQIMNDGDIGETHGKIKDIVEKIQDIVHQRS